MSENTEKKVDIDKNYLDVGVGINIGKIEKSKFIQINESQQQDLAEAANKRYSRITRAARSNLLIGYNGG